MTSRIEACGMRGQGGLVAVAVWLGGGERRQLGRRILEQAVRLEFTLSGGKPTEGLKQESYGFPCIILQRQGRLFSPPALMAVPHVRGSQRPPCALEGGDV